MTQKQLKDTNLRGLNLRNADLYGANLYGLNLRNADLYGADLCEAYLCEVNLCNADLRGADLRGADLCGADLRGADLCNADLCGADLRGADLCGADLRGANLYGALISCTSFTNANIDATTKYFHSQCPEKGAFIGYKKAGEYVIELEICADAQRSSATTRKCRCSKAKVIAIYNIDKTFADVNEVRSKYDANFIYRVGEIVEEPNFNENRWLECAQGIHFFLTFNEAKNYIM